MRVKSEKLCECGCGQYTNLALSSNEEYGWIRGEPVRFVHGHHARKKSNRIFDQENYEIDSNGCWNWKKNKSPYGYGRINIKGKVELVHRVAYELKVGKIPDGLVIDHICENPSCFNIEHLQVVTNQENIKLASVRSGELTREEILIKIHAQRENLKAQHQGEDYLIDTSGCWIWMKGISTRGYGRTWIKQDNSMRYAHRIMYEKYNGKIESHMVIHHKCENHICVNPDHLEPVTNKENVMKRWNKRKGGN